LSQAEFAGIEGVSVSTLRRWLTRHGSWTMPAAPAMLPVFVRPRLEPEATSARPRERSMASRQASPSGVRLDLRGVTVDLEAGFDRADLGAVVEVLRGLPGMSA
jgi:hypothetical protein